MQQCQRFRGRDNKSLGLQKQGNTHLLRNAAKHDQTKHTPTAIAVKVAKSEIRLRFDHTCRTDKTCLVIYEQQGKRRGVSAKSDTLRCAT